MRILLDTHILLWALFVPEKLGDGIRSEIEAAEHDVAFSAASIWEIAIKSQTGGGLPATAEQVLSAAIEAGFAELRVSSAAAARVAHLPLLHRNPFGRLLVAQAMTEHACLYTADRQLGDYSDLVRLV